MVHCAVMAALSLACHSKGVGPAGVRSCFQLREHGVQVCKNQWMYEYLSGRGVGGRLVIALSSFAFPHDQVF
jgi:predicted NAD/FAD-dependent oxidoreductase